MNFLRLKTTWANWEFIPMKLCIATAYITIGTYFHDIISPFYIPVLVIFAITVIWTLIMWLNKMKEKN